MVAPPDQTVQAVRAEMVLLVQALLEPLVVVVEVTEVVLLVETPHLVLVVLAVTTLAALVAVHPSPQDLMAAVAVAVLVRLAT